MVVLVAAFLVGPMTSSLSLGNYFGHSDTYRYLTTGYLRMSYHLPGVFSDNRFGDNVNGSIWTIPAELLMYVMVSAVFCLGRDRRLVGWILALITIGLAVADSYVHFYLPALPQQPLFGKFDVYGLSKNLLSTDPYTVLHIAPYFWMGACFNYFGWKRHLNLQVAILILFCLLIFETPTLVFKVGSLVMIPAMAYITLSLGFAPRPKFAKVFGLGDISYGVYLYGFMLQQLFSHYFKYSSPYENFAVSLPVILVCGWVSWNVIEKPFLKLKPKASFKSQGHPPLPIEPSSDPHLAS